MNRTPLLITTAVAFSLTAAAGLALAAQDRFTLQVPNGHTFSEFRGYETWPTVAVSQTSDGLKVMTGNPAMMEAYKSGGPANGKAFPNGAKIAKIEWEARNMAAAPSPTREPGVLRSVSFMEKDDAKFKATGGWGYAQFKYDAATDSFSPVGSGTGCGAGCHTLAKARDYVFTGYPKR